MVFYGSQTGTAEEFAGRLAKEGIRYKMKGMVADPEECDMVRISFFYMFISSLSFIVRIIYQIKYELEILPKMNSKKSKFLRKTRDSTCLNVCSFIGHRLK